MADHVRKQIRDYIAALLEDLTTTETRVFTNRVRAMKKKDLPGLIIYTVEEDSDPGAVGGHLNRTLDLAVEAYVKTSETIDDDLDTIAAEVETAIASDPTLGGLAQDVLYASSELFLDGEGDKKTGVIRMIFQVGYRTAKTDPTTTV